MWAKRRLNGTSKVNRRTDGQTDGRTDRRKFQLIESISPEGRCFENYLPTYLRDSSDSSEICDRSDSSDSSDNFVTNRFSIQFCD